MVTDVITPTNMVLRTINWLILDRVTPMQAVATTIRASDIPVASAYGAVRGGRTEPDTGLHLQ